MSTVCSVDEAKRFWSSRNTYIVFNDPRQADKVIAYENKLKKQLENEQMAKSDYLSTRKFIPEPQDAFGINQVKKVPSDLHFWATYSSWSYCLKCKSLFSKILPYNFSKRAKNKSVTVCSCSTERYVIPLYENIPTVLLNLTVEDINVLRPFYLFFENTETQSHGYRVKCCPIKLRISNKSVLAKIAALSDETQKERCKNAYNYLISSEESKYSHFVHLRDHISEQDRTLNLFNFKDTEGIECALWPNLYPFTSWCESMSFDNGSRLSSKVAFCKKLFSEILDYGLHFELLQFQYDRWVYRTVTGAINTARMLKCSPARSLDTKTFSPTYWQWQHRFVLDAVNQFGLPDIFITLSPYEWSFPFPQWLNDIRHKTGRGPTDLSGYETAHVVHILAQIVRGYLCGSNSNKWSQHVFSYNRIAKQTNINTYFYRFEFQKRGTAHLHLLIWLKDITKIQHHLIRADIPNDSHDLSYLVNKYQKSDKPSNCLTLQEEKSFFENRDGRHLLRLKHPADAFASNLRAYISTLLPMLQCSMDFQTTDGRAMLLRYVCSYVTKSQDGMDPGSLYSYNVTGGQAAVRYLMDTKPAEPEMWLALSSTKISWSSSRTKRYIVPSPETAMSNNTAEKYRNRKSEMNHYSFIDWLRLVDHSKTKPQLYKTNNTLVGLKTVSFFNKYYFFQYVLMHHPHRCLSQLQHPDHDNIPDALQWYAAAIHHFPQFWRDDEKVTNFLHNRGNQSTYITTCIAYLHTLADTFFLWQTQIISCISLNTSLPNVVDQFNLHNEQRTVQNHVISALNKRSEYYSTFNDMNDSPSSDSDSEDIYLTEDSPPTMQCYPLSGENIDVEWKKPVVVTGQAGSGKSYTIKSIVNRLKECDANVLVSTPTGFLASVFKATLPQDVDCETVHASFHFPVNDSTPPTINWALSSYDIIIIDEISMIPNIIFQHILKTLNVLLFRPVLMLCGDCGQQQPFCRANGKIMQIQSPFDDTSFLAHTYCYHLRQQHRVGDQHYLSFLNHIRNWVPTQELLDQIQQDRVVTNEDNISDDDILRAFYTNGENVLLTFTKKAANRANKAIVQAIFSNKIPLMCTQLDCDLEPFPIYAGMRVVITQNRDKANGVVNGQRALVELAQNKSVFLKLTTGRIVPLYPVTTKKDGTLITVYPFVPAYAMTMCKAQGQTLSKVVLWFDIETIPPGTAYVALSRVRNRNDVYFLNKLKPNYFTPVRRPNNLL